MKAQNMIKTSMSSSEIKTLVQGIHVEATLAAVEAAQAFLAEHGEPLYCGFAWVKIPAKASTKLGKALMEIGFEKSYNGGLTLYDPSNSRTQSMDIKETGSRAYADVFVKHGINAYMCSRAD